ncbi:MAG: 50S ribosomal protein L37Ae [Candidatus Njordarchaeia archaeon]
MGRTKKVGSTGRFGARYGSGVRKKVLRVEKKKKNVYVCPVCKKRALKWKAVGIWVCSSCGTKVAGGAWEPITEVGKKVIMTMRRMKMSTE